MEKEKKKRKKFHEFTAENDMKYRGPLNYQHFQIVGWACIVAAVAAAIISLGGKMVGEAVMKRYGTLGSILSFMSQFSLPLLLIASFSRILNSNDSGKKMLLINGGAAVGIIAVTLLLGSRYFIGILKQIIAPAEKVVPMMNGIIAGVVPGGFLAFNMFVDLFLCTLMMFLLNVQPKRWFTGKKVLILRFAVIIPIAYEGFCFWLKIQAMRGKVMLPMWSYPLLTMKPPVMILLFIVMAFVVKIREYRYCKHGNTHEDYQAFMQTNRNSFHLSVRLAILMVIFAVLDLVLLVLLTYLNADSAGALNAAGEMAEEASDTFVSLSLAVGIGKSWPIGLLAPFMLLFSYNKEPKNKMISMVLPAVAIVLCIFIVLEATRMGLHRPGSDPHGRGHDHERQTDQCGRGRPDAEISGWGITAAFQKRIII